MNNCVPDFEIEMDDDEYPIPLSSGFCHLKKPFVPDDGIMELFWQNGPVVMPSQSQRPLRKPPPASHAGDAIPSGPSTAREIENIRPAQQVENYQNQNLLMQEDEMASWLDDSSLDQSFCADLLYSPPPTINNNNQINNSTMQINVRTSQLPELRHPSRSVAPRPPIPPTRRPEQVQMRVHESVQFSKHNARVGPGPSSSKTGARESTVVDSCETPAAAATAVASAVSETVRSSAEPTEGDAWRGSMSTTGVAAPSTTTAGGGTGWREAMTCEMTATSSEGGSSGSAEAAHRPPAEDRKRKGRKAEDSECHSEDLDCKYAEAKKQVRRSTSTRRSRAAEVHNLSERRRRDRINEKMRALQELIPRCNKSDKASMLDEAIEYLKSLQLQVQMMSMGCGMVPMMYPGMQQYMAAMGMGMGMEMGMNRPVMSFPNMLAASALPAAAAAAHLGPRFPVPPFHMPHVPAPELSRMQAANQSDNMFTSLTTSDPTQSRIPNLSDPYHQYLGPHQMQLQLMQAMIQQNVSKPSTSGGHENTENHQSENR